MKRFNVLKYHIKTGPTQTVSYVRTAVGVNHFISWHLVNAKTKFIEGNAEISLLYANVNLRDGAMQSVCSAK